MKSWTSLNTLIFSVKNHEYFRCFSKVKEVDFEKAPWNNLKNFLATYFTVWFLAWMSTKKTNVVFKIKKEALAQNYPKRT